jgi:hypothetical protein
MSGEQSAPTVIYLDIISPSLGRRELIGPYKEANDGMDVILREVGAPIDLLAFVVPRTSGPMVVLVKRDPGASWDESIKWKIVERVQKFFARPRIDPKNPVLETK